MTGYISSSWHLLPRLHHFTLVLVPQMGSVIKVQQEMELGKDKIPSVEKSCVCVCLCVSRGGAGGYEWEEGFAERETGQRPQEGRVVWGCQE